MWQRWTVEEKEKLRTYYGKIRVEELASQLGRTVKQVREAAKRFCKLKKRNRYKKYRKQLLQLHREGVNTYRIAAILNLPISTVEYWLQKKNLKGNGHDAESWLMARRTKRQNKIVKNVALIWKCLLRLYPHKEKDVRVQRYGEFEDLVQDCLQHVLRKCLLFDSKKGKLSTWVYTTVHRYSFRVLHTAGIVRSSSHYTKNPDKDEIERRERARSVGTITEKEHWIKGEDGRESQEKLDTQKEVRHAMMSCLTPEERNVIRSSYFQNLTEKEIATKMTRTAAYIKMIKRRAMQKLRAYMEKRDVV